MGKEERKRRGMVGRRRCNLALSRPKGNKEERKNSEEAKKTAASILYPPSPFSPCENKRYGGRGGWHKKITKHLVPKQRLLAYFKSKTSFVSLRNKLLIFYFVKSRAISPLCPFLARRRRFSGAAKKEKEKYGNGDCDTSSYQTKCRALLQFAQCEICCGWRER